uniref:D-2-hydroxyglutarate dehydrogenase, mitochondrial-like n=1 Tax=Myxine glutinosa TaxID=7769 RepID=UPI00358E10EC
MLPLLISRSLWNLRHRCPSTQRLICRHLALPNGGGKFQSGEETLVLHEETGKRTAGDIQSNIGASTITRLPFAILEPEDLAFFQQLLPNRALTDPDVLASANVDWLRNVQGRSQILLKPQTVEEVSLILRHCHSRGLAITPQGGNTGLVGGGVPIFDEVIVSMALMNHILDFDHWQGVLVCEAGCVLESVMQYVEERGHVIPLDLGSKGSCQIGGVVSTNAGGLRFIRYGSLHGNVLGLQAVLADGQILDLMTQLRKDNTGYDLKQLMIGSEGTLGVVTSVALLCPAMPVGVSLAYLGCTGFPGVLATLCAARARLGETLSAIEFFDRRCAHLVHTHLGLDPPISGELPFYVVVEMVGSDSHQDNERMSAFVEKVVQEGHVADGTIATSPGKVKTLWAYRERVPEAILHDGHVIKYDICVSISKMYDIVTATRQRFADRTKNILGYGHLGDGNLHLNVSSTTHDPKLHSDLDDFVYGWTAKHRGSISAEHGLGVLKRNAIGYSKSSDAIALMRRLKNFMDPKGILNPYKVLPSEL